MNKFTARNCKNTAALAASMSLPTLSSSLDAKR